MRQYKNTIEAIYLHLDEVQQLVAEFGANGKVYSIDIDLALDKLRNVYDLMLSLKIESLSNADVEVDPTEVPLEINPQVQFVEEPKLVAQVKETSIGDTIRAQITKEDDEAAEIEREKERTRAEKESRVRTPQSNYTNTENYKENPVYNEEPVTQKNQVDITSYIKSKPISNITAAIGLNEKFELIQNLFGGDKVKFEQTMNYLNAASDFNEAYEYLAGNFKWDMNSTYVQKILELIRKKLIVKKNER